MNPFEDNMLLNARKDMERKLEDLERKQVGQKMLDARNKSALPDNNPKTAQGVTKIALNLVPPSVKHYLAKAFADGARKYGAYNWRDKKVSASIYYAALQRHMDAWWDGEDIAEDSKIEHLAHAAACVGILIDAYTSGNLIDDRPTKGAAARLQLDYVKKGEQIERDKYHNAVRIDEPAISPIERWNEYQATYAMVEPGVSCCEAHVLPKDK